MDVLHCDLNNFFASVEMAIDPSLTAKYIAVSGNPDKRQGIILAKNTSAKQMGVKTGEPIWQAMKKCPQLVCVPPHYEYYSHYSDRVHKIYERYTDKVECFGMDECWLDVTHSKIMGTPYQIAEALREQVKKETGLTISVGVSFTKTFAKLGSDMKKPDATTVIDRENFRRVVWPLDVAEMLFVGTNTKQKLNSMGIFTLGDLANANITALKNAFGIVGEKLKLCANGMDTDPVAQSDSPRAVKSVSHGTTTLKDMVSYKDVDSVISCLAEMVAMRMRKYGMRGSVVGLDIRNNLLQHTSAQVTINNTFVASDIYHSATRLLRTLWNETTGLPLRSVTVQVSKLVPACSGVQMTLFDSTDEKQQQLEFYLDKIRKRYGFNAITRANVSKQLINPDMLYTEDDLLPFKK